MSTTAADVHMTANGATPACERPVIRLFGPLSIEDGERSLGPRDLGGARPKQVLEILLAARGHRVPDRPPGGARSGGRPAGQRRRLAPDLRFRAAPPPHPRPRTGTRARRHGAGGVPLRDRARRARPRPLRRAARALRREPTAALAPRSSRRSASCAATSSRTSRTPPGRSTCAAATRGASLGARLDAADAALAELDFAAALAHAEAAVALDRFSERAQRSRDARALRARPNARGARPLPRLPHAPRRGARTRADRRDARARGGHHPPGGRPLAAPSPDPAGHEQRPPDAHSACSAGPPSSRRSHGAVRRGARRGPGADPDRG